MDYEKKSEVLKALGHPVRLRMVEGLMDNECNVTNIVEDLNLPQSTVSQHLGILKRNGILRAHKNGVQTCYCVENESVRDIIKILR